MTSRPLLFLAAAAIVACAPAGARAATCDSLSSLKLPNTTITAAQTTVPGSFTVPSTPPVNVPNPAVLSKLPAFCRVLATLAPTSDSDIKIEVWLPSSGWNGKLQSVGNGAWGGVIPYPALAQAVLDGYAGAGTDTGHAGNTAKFVPGHPEKLVDYGYRAVHEMTIVAKAVTAAFYGNAPSRSYWNGCSTGGRQGLMEAWKYPGDYDAVIAGAPVNYRTHQMTAELWIAQAVHKTDASYIPPAKYPAIHRAVLDACDAKDELKDGLIDDPRACRVDPAVLQCKEGDMASCLTAPQVAAARQIYSPARGPLHEEGDLPGASARE